MRGITGHGHYHRDEALEPLARVMYEPRPLAGVSGARTVSLGQEASSMIESVAEEVGRAILDLEMGSDEPVAEESAGVSAKAVRPLEFAGRIQNDNRYVNNNDSVNLDLDFQTTITVIISILLSYGGLEGILAYFL